MRNKSKSLLVIICHSLFFLFIFSSLASAASRISLPVQLTVAQNFSLGINTAQLDFGEVTPGDAKFDIPLTDPGLRITAVTNAGNPWFLQVSASSDFINTATSVAATLPLSILHWYPIYSEYQGVSPAPGTINTPPPGQSFTMTTSPVLIYSSGIADKVTLSTLVDLRFGVVVPTDALQGTYQTTVKFTMTE